MEHQFKPLADDDRTRFEDYLKRVWFGNKEVLQIPVLDGNGELIVRHERTDNKGTVEEGLVLDIVIPQDGSMSTARSEWTEELSDNGENFVRLVAAIGSIIGGTFNYNGKVDFYRIDTFEEKVTYRATVGFSSFTVVTDFL